MKYPILDKRDVFSYCLIGFNKTGKTELAKRIAREWKRTRPGQNVMAFDPQHKFKGIANKFLSEHEGDWLEEALKLRNGLLILDELRMLHPAHQADRRLVKLFSMRSGEDWNNDIIYIVHSPKMVLEVLDTYTTHYRIFYTQARSNQWKDKIANFENCISAHNLINRYVTRYGKGAYPHFPYVEVDNMGGEISCINMDPKKVTGLFKKQEV